MATKSHHFSGLGHQLKIYIWTPLSHQRQKLTFRFKVVKKTML